MTQHVTTCYFMLALSLLIGLSTSQTPGNQRVLCSVPNNPGKTIQLGGTHTDECQTCKCNDTGVANCFTNCPKVSLSAKCSSALKKPRLVKIFGDRCNCSKLWCEPGVQYFVGWLEIINSKFGEIHGLYNCFAGKRQRPVEVSWVRQLSKPVYEALQIAYPNTFEFADIRVILLSNLTGSIGVNFRLTTHLTISQKPGDLSDLLKILQSAMTSAPHSQIDTQRILLLSAEYCYPSKQTVSGLLLNFPMSTVGTIPSEQICGTTGKPLGEWKCVGNFTTGLYWLDRPRVIPCSEQESAVTVSLRKLSKITTDASNVEYVTSETADLAKNSKRLNTADIVLVSRIVHGVSLFTNISQQVTKNILQIVNNVMAANTPVIARSQKVFNAASRLTRASETITSKMHLERNSSFVEVLPNIVVAIYDQGVNTTNKVSGIQLVSSSKGDSLEETLVQPLYNGGTNRDISTTDVTINLPVSAVDPKGILYLFNETKNSKIVIGERLSADTTNVSTVEDCASLCTSTRQSSKIWEVCTCFNFHEASKLCELRSSFTTYDYLEPLVDWSSYVYVPEWETGQKISFTLYNNWKLFQTPYEVYRDAFGVNKWLTYSKIVSVKINTRSLKVYLEEPLVATFLPGRRARFTNASTVCGYWDYDIGDFSQEGCWSNGTVNGRHVCMCDHLTNFAILLDVHGTPIDEGNKLALSIISIIGLSLSIAGLLCTIITYLVFKKLRRGRSHQTLLNLSLALLLSMIVFLAGIEQTANRAGCITVAVLLHYLILVSFAWMLVKGVLQYLRFVKVLGTYMPRFMLKTCLLSWGIPLLFVIIPVAVDPDLYGGKEYCWLSRDLFYYGFMIPVCCAIVVNTVFFVLVVRALTCARATHLQTNQSERKVAILHLYAGVSTLLLLGITWVFGFLAINDARLVFQYIFCICNSLQGFFILIFFNLRDKRVRNAWRGLLCKKKEGGRPYSVKSETYNSNVRRTSEELSKGKNPSNSLQGR